MKKIFIWFFISLTFFWWTYAYVHSQDTDNALEEITWKMDIIIEEKWEVYRDNFIKIFEKYKIKYENKETYSYVFNYLLNHLTEKKVAPNILLIIADDMWLDASPWYDDYNWLKPNTPVLDNLAENWLVFDNVWSNPLCSPTRATILTWKYWFQTWVLWALSKSDAWISTDEYSLQKMITEKSTAGYEQAVIWKWHLATDHNWADNNPELMWIPYYSGFIWWAMQDYSKWRKTTNWESKLSKTYATTEFTNDSISWLEENGDKPWFLWLAYTAPHSPFHVPPSDLLSDKTNDSLSWTEADIVANPVSYYLAAIEAMDTEIGRLLDNLSEEERENTIIIFIGDNGTPNEVAQTPYTSSTVKWSISKGWIHIPMIISWDWIDSWRAEEFVNTSDLYTTIAELSWIILPTYWNSISFAPVLFWNQRRVERDYLYAEVESSNPNWWASRKNGWTIRKNWYQYISLDNWTEKLFSDSDLWQENNLINTYPWVVSELRELWISLRIWDTVWTYGNYPTDTDDIVCHDYFTNNNWDYTAVPEPIISRVMN